MDDEADLSGEGSSDEADESGDDFERDFIDIASQPVGSIAVGCALPGQPGWLSCLGGAGLWWLSRTRGACTLFCRHCYTSVQQPVPYMCTWTQSLSHYSASITV